MRIGIFGGTFDPPHLGHLIMAERCREEASLDEVWFLPSYVPPHKTDVPKTRFEHRCDMVTLAIAGSLSFRMMPIEKELPPPSYTAETLAHLHRLHPEHEFSLIIGGDSLHDLPTWYQPGRVVEQAALLAVARPGWKTVSATELAAKLGLSPDAIRLQIVDCPLIDIASRDLRRRAQQHQSIRFMVPRSVEQFIIERKLYI